MANDACRSVSTSLDQCNGCWCRRGGVKAPSPPPRESVGGGGEVRPVDDSSWLGSFSSVLSYWWLGGDGDDIWPIKEPIPLYPKLFFQNKWRKKTKGEPANPGSPPENRF